MLSKWQADFATVFKLLHEGAQDAARAAVMRQLTAQSATRKPNSKTLDAEQEMQLVSLANEVATRGYCGYWIAGLLKPLVFSSPVECTELQSSLIFAVLNSDFDDTLTVAEIRRQFNNGSEGTNSETDGAMD